DRVPSIPRSSGVKSVYLLLLLAATALASSSVNCSYLENPSQFEYSPTKHWRIVSERTDEVGGHLPALSNRFVPAPQTATPTPRKNFIDEYIFGRMERDGITPAPLADDQTFLRRLFLDLTGRPPSPEQVRAFAYEPGTAKRDIIADALIGNVEFINKWTMFLGDLYKNNANA